MLFELLKLIKEKKMTSQYELAEALNTSPDNIQSWMDYLCRMGYLKKTNMMAGCGQDCSGCHGGCQCGSGIQGSELYLFELVREQG